MNFAVTLKQVSSLDIGMAIEGIAKRFPSMEDDEYRWKVCTSLKVKTTVKTIMPPAGLRAMSQLQKDSSMKILPAEKGTGTAFSTTSNANMAAVQTSKVKVILMSLHGVS